MKRIFLLLTCLSATYIGAEDETFSDARLTAFYDVFFCEEKDDLAAANLTITCDAAGANSNPFTPPPNPGPPAPIAGMLPVVIVNHSTVPDDQVFVVVTGEQQTTDIQSFISIDGSGVGTLVIANPGDNASNYGLALSQLPQTSDGRVIYLPVVISALVWFSMGQKLDMPVNAPHDIVQPNFLSSADPNYYVNYDVFEITYTTLTSPNIAADATAVSFHSIPLFGYISTPSSVNSTTGLYQPRSFIMSHVASVFSTAHSPEVNQWNSLFLTNGSTILRVISPGKGMSNTPTPYFDENYLDNAAAYGYSYLNDIWTGSGSFYRMNPLVMTIPNGSLETYTGGVNAFPDNKITLTSSPSGYQVVFAAPTTTTPTTSFNIFSAKLLVLSDTSPGAADGVQLSKLFEEAVIAGLVPTAHTLSNPYLASNQGIYYTVNTKLTPPGGTTGPWYDLYSKALHSLGYIYTFGFDEPLWPQVQIFSNTLQSSTYIGITIGSVQ
jgi:hypothetical protein